MMDVCFLHNAQANTFCYAPIPDALQIVFLGTGCWDIVFAHEIPHEFVIPWNLNLSFQFTVSALCTPWLCKENLGGGGNVPLVANIRRNELFQCCRAFPVIPGFPTLCSRMPFAMTAPAPE